MLPQAAGHFCDQVVSPSMAVLSGQHLQVRYGKLHQKGELFFGGGKLVAPLVSLSR